MKIYYLLIFLIMNACSTISPEINKNNTISVIQKISHIKDIEGVLRTADKDSLVIFDVDYVIITTEDMISRPKGKEAARHLWKQYEKLFGKSYNEMLISRFLHQIEYKLVEPVIKDIINSLVNKDIPTIALTKLGTHPYGEIKNPMDWRFLSLKKQGVYFPFVKMQQKALFDDEAGVENGIIYAGKKTKGDALKHALGKAEFRPKQIIFIDDFIENLRTVESYCLANGIKFFGFQYLAKVFDDDVKPKSCLIEWQIELLKNNRPWVSDKDALKQIPYEKCQ